MTTLYKNLELQNSNADKKRQTSIANNLSQWAPSSIRAHFVQHIRNRDEGTKNRNGNNLGPNQ